MYVYLFGVKLEEILMVRKEEIDVVFCVIMCMDMFVMDFMDMNLEEFFNINVFLVILMGFLLKDLINLGVWFLERFI